MLDKRSLSFFVHYKVHKIKTYKNQQNTIAKTNVNLAKIQKFKIKLEKKILVLDLQIDERQVSNKMTFQGANKFASLPNILRW
jgi:hypothetical protein